MAMQRIRCYASRRPSSTREAYTHGSRPWAIICRPSRVSIRRLALRLWFFQTLRCITRKGRLDIEIRQLVTFLLPAHRASNQNHTREPFATF